MSRGRYRVVLEPDEDGNWIVTVPAVPGCHSYGRTIEQARRRIREALSLWVDDAGSAELREDLRLPQPARAAVRQSRDARARAERNRIEAQEMTAQAARRLAEDLRLGLRDAGELLGLSHQRVQQLLRDGDKRRRSHTRRRSGVD
jgi:predicted RNase H-like HicB family nuclease